MTATTTVSTLIIITRSQSGEIETRKKGLEKNKQMFKNGNKMKIDRKINNTTMTTNHVRRLSHTFFLGGDEEKSVCFIQSKEFVRYSLCVFFFSRFIKFPVFVHIKSECIHAFNEFCFRSFSFVGFGFVFAHKSRASSLSSFALLS